MSKMKQSVYQLNGYESRKDYLECLAEDTGQSIETVIALSDILGPTEDFDGLVTSLEDM